MEARFCYLRVVKEELVNHVFSYEVGECDCLMKVLLKDHGKGFTKIKSKTSNEDGTQLVQTTCI